MGKAKRERVLKETTADTMNEVLQGVFTPGGTAAGDGCWLAAWPLPLRSRLG